MIKLDEQFTSYFGEPSIGAWRSDTYEVAAFQDQNAVRLDIARIDEKDGITWDELQRIKSECGYGDNDAIEFYPKDSNVINTANIRHLYVFDSDLNLIRRA